MHKIGILFCIKLVYYFYHAQIPQFTLAMTSISVAEQQRQCMHRLKSTGKYDE